MRKRVAPTAALFVGWVKEATGANDGPWVEAILRLVGLGKGLPWCAAFVTMGLDIAYRGANPLPRTASCDVLLAHARAHGMLVAEPAAGDVFLLMKTPTDAVHAGFVTDANATAAKTIEGNTNEGGSRDGWGVFARTRKRSPLLLFIRLPEAA